MYLLDTDTIAIVINTSWNIYNFRVGLLKALQKEGYRIVAIAPHDTFSHKLEELGFDPEEFVRVKEKFSKENDWASDVVCFGSISYCCMRAGGCPRRDVALVDRYSGMPMGEIMKLYFQKKKELSKRILERIENQEGKDKVKELLDLL